MTFIHGHMPTFCITDLFHKKRRRLPLSKHRIKVLLQPKDHWISSQHYSAHLPHSFWWVLVGRVVGASHCERTLAVLLNTRDSILARDPVPGRGVIRAQSTMYIECCVGLLGHSKQSTSSAV